MANTGIYEEDYDSDSSALGVDSDVESNFTESPADGYFTERSHPRETFVENSSISAAAEAKARERAEERASSSAAVPPSQQSSPTSRSRSVEWDEGEAPLVNQEDAPPDYESAISSQPSTQNQHSQQNDRHAYIHGQQPPSTESHSHNPSIIQHGVAQPPSNGSRHSDAFTATGAPMAAQIVTFGRAPQGSDPQSMRDANVTPVDEESGLLSGLKRKQKKRRWCAGCCKSMSFCNIILFVAIVILFIIIAGAADDRSESGNPKEPHDGNDEDHGHDGDSPSDPTIPPKQPGAVLPPSTSRCPYGAYSRPFIFDFIQPHNFSFVELMESSTWVSDNIHGQVTVQPAQHEQSVDIRLHVKYATTSPWKFLSSNYEKTNEALVLQLPIMEKGDGDSSQKPCLWVDIVAEVRSGVVLDAWEISTGNLDVVVKDCLFNRKEGEEELSILQVKGSSIFNAVRGAIRIDYWSSRETEVSVISGSIKGGFALLDLLSLSSQSGSISVAVDPRKADEKNPKPAEFLAKSRSGTVKVQYPQSGDIPEREYSTRVETASASISGDYILGELTSFHSQSGTISAQLLPYFDRKRRSTMHTDSRSGSTKLQVITPYAHPGEDWSNAHAIHKSESTSGSISILYPDEWSGTIDETSTTGSLNCKGKGVEIISDGRDGLVFRHLIAQKRYGKGDMTVKSTTGSVKVRFGEGED